MTDKDDYLTPNQVADLLKVAPVTVRHWSLDGKLQFVTTPGGHRRYAYADVVQFARSHGVQVPGGQTDMRILIVDDNKDLAKYIAGVLSNKTTSCIIDVAFSGFEAGAKVHTFKPDIVLLDLMMPELNGFDTCKKIKDEPATRHIRVIAMTGYPSDENLQRIRDAGAEECLAKPFRAPELLKALKLDSQLSRSNIATTHV